MARRPFTPIDHFTLAGIREGKDFERRIRQFHWKFFAELDEQRSRAATEITKTLVQASVDRFEFGRWQRAVRARWFLKPLSAAGSLVFPGGRFNIGRIEPSFAAFPALYLAEDKPTALQEAFQPGEAPPGSALSSLDLSLMNEASAGWYSVSGRCATLIDLRDPERLRPFVDLIGSFKLSTEIRRAARDLSREVPALANKLLVTRTKELIDSVLSSKWKELPVQLGLPSSSQIFGQLLVQARIEGVLYPSKFTGRACAAVFPQCLAHSSSFLELDDPPPRRDMKTRLDRNSWEALSR